MTQLRCPVCPMCGELPMLILQGAVQAFCGNDDCKVWAWNPSATALENLNDMGEVRISEVPSGD